MSHKSLLIGVFSTVLMGACTTATGRKVETAVAQRLVTIEQENKIGLQVKNDLEQNQKIVYMADASVVAYVRGVADKVIQFGKKDRPDVQWQVFVIDGKTVNAFATPGGFLYVYRGLLDIAKNEAELAGVMAHETGHVVGRHSARSLVNAYGLEAVVGLAVGDNPGLLTQITTGIAAKGLMLHHTRSDETEADEFGARYTAAAGYDPHALMTLFESMKKGEGKTPALLTYLSDHPATDDRIAHIDSYINAKKLTGTNLGTEPYQQMLKHLKTLPPAPSDTGSSGAPPTVPASGTPAKPAAAPAPPANAPPVL